jgi:hypothetical protein
MYWYGFKHRHGYTSSYLDTCISTGPDPSARYMHRCINGTGSGTGKSTSKSRCIGSKIILWYRRSLAGVSSGASEFFDAKRKSSWQPKVASQIRKVRISISIRVRIRVKVTVKVTVRVRLKVRLEVREGLLVRVRVRVRVRSRLRFELGLG